MIGCRLSVDLMVAGPFLTRATAAGTPGIDAPFLRQAAGGDSLLCVPGTLVKGRLRDAWTELASCWPAEPVPCPEIDTLLGPPPETSGPVAVHGNRLVARLRFGDFTRPAPKQTGVQHRIRIDAHRGAASDGALQVVEAIVVRGETTTFSGVIDFVARDAAEAEQVCRQVLIGLRWLPSLGGLTRVGFGRLVDVAVSLSTVTIAQAIVPALTAGNRSLSLRLTFDRPICLARPRREDNVFESEDYVTGGTIKGALAATWAEFQGRRSAAPVDASTLEGRPALARHFAALRFLHAYPAQPGPGVVRPAPLPLSLVEVGRGKDYFDVALSKGADRTGLERMAFRRDWKKHPQPAQLQDAVAPAGVARELRVRTAIDPDARRAANNKLFAYEYVQTAGLVWHAAISLDGVPDDDREAVALELVSLLKEIGAIRGVGKTKAVASVECKWAEPEVPALKGGLAIVMLRSAAVLADPGDLSEGFDAEALGRSYAKVFDKLSDGALQLDDDRYFAHQELAGGMYLYHRFQKGTGPYRPFLLTSPGSVFVLRPSAKGTDAEAKANTVLERWALHGLGIPAWAIARHQLGSQPSEFWRRCPYVPENGFGEVAINQGIHWSMTAPVATSAVGVRR